jgi:hypothetical protein
MSAPMSDKIHHDWNAKNRENCCFLASNCSSIYPRSSYVIDPCVIQKEMTCRSESYPKEASASSISEKQGRGEEEKLVSFPDLDDSTFSDTRSIPSLSDYSDEDIKAQWFASEDFRIFKLTAKQIAIQARKSGFSQLLLDSFSEIRTGHCSTEEDPLVLWAKHGHMRRGLEQWVSPKHGEERQERKEDAITAVLKAQRMLRSVNSDPIFVEHHLAELSLFYSKKAADFARRMGEADALAALAESGQRASRHRLSRGVLPQLNNGTSTTLNGNSSDFKEETKSQILPVPLPTRSKLGKKPPAGCNWAA